MTRVMAIISSYPVKKQSLPVEVKMSRAGEMSWNVETCSATYCTSDYLIKIQEPRQEGRLENEYKM